MKTRILFTFALIVVLSAGNLFAQRGFTDLKTEENLKIMYRWQNVVPGNKASDAVLSLRVTNENDYAVRWTFTVIFYSDRMAQYESETTTVCMKPGQSLRGGIAGLRFTAPGLKLEDVQSESFTLEFGDFSVERVAGCR